ncbi:hypothetical protein MTR_1g027850 [Medicago truncatula]|uniref:Uncharacterized protein n=1 Tax=Medicago truncatula TaxID=3880 RepID=A0A072VEF7_MEDTR|nr:hypothetical protein MTR_1g027850 [Medicago truncatula]
MSEREKFELDRKEDPWRFVCIRFVSSNQAGIYGNNCKLKCKQTQFENEAFVKGFGKGHVGYVNLRMKYLSNCLERHSSQSSYCLEDHGAP